MKRMMILAVVASLMFSFLFTGCEEDGAATGLTDDEVSKIAMASVGSIYIATLFNPEGVFPEDGDYGIGTFSGVILSGNLNVTTVNATTTLLTFTACELDLDGDAGGDITLGGEVSVEFDATDITTYDAFNVIGAMPGTDTVINVIVAGTTTITATTGTVDITLSGITAQACAVVIVMTVVDNYPVGVALATIDGVDYTDEFNTAFNTALAEFGF